MTPISFQKLLLALLLLTGASSSPTSSTNRYVAHAMQKRAGLNVLKTTVTEDQTIDWIPLMSQNHGKIAAAPPLRTIYAPTNASVPVAELQKAGATTGPPGTVPVPRVSTTYLDNTAQKGSPRTDWDDVQRSGKEKRQYAGTHWYVTSDQPVSNVGGSAVYSVFKAYVANNNDFSLLQTAVTRSSSAGGQTLEAGWINYPAQVSAPHLFTYYTTNGYTAQGNNIGGWNQDVAGWVQTDTEIFPGTVFSPNSVDGGDQYEIQIEYYLYQGNWWLWVLDRWIGYYPGTLYSNVANPSLGNGSDTIFYYGEIYQSEGPETTSDMGSGEYAATGFGKSAYIHNMIYNDVSAAAQYYTAGFGDSDSSRYTHDAHPNSGEDWGSYVYLGGPGAGGVVGG